MHNLFGMEYSRQCLERRPAWHVLCSSASAMVRVSSSKANESSILAWVTQAGELLGLPNLVRVLFRGPGWRSQDQDDGGMP